MVSETSKLQEGMEEMSSTKGLKIAYAPAGRSSATTLTAKFDGEVLEVATIDLTKPKARGVFRDTICKDGRGIEPETVDKELLRIAAEVQTSMQNSRPNKSDSRPNRAEPAELLAKMPESAKAKARQLLEDPVLMERILDDVSVLGVAGERELIATTYLVGVSRLLQRPLAQIVQGLSSSGKSYAIEQTARLFPAEAVIHATAMTPQALFYMPPGSLEHKFIVAGERSRVETDDTAEATRALREMLSAGKLSKLIPLKIDGRMETKRIEQEGPIAYVESTTLTKIFDEDANRCLLLHTDERPQQTRRIVQKLADGYTGASRRGDVERIIEWHHALQRMIEKKDVVVPYAERLAELLQSDRVEMRRAFPQLMSLIQASALLHQRQRRIDREGRVIASEDDYQLTRHLLAKPFERLLGGGLSDPARRFFDELDPWAGDSEFTTTKANDQWKSRMSRRALTGYLLELAEAGLVDQVEPPRGNKPATWRMAGVQPDSVDGPAALPSSEDVSVNHFRHSDTEQIESVSGVV